MKKFFYRSNKTLLWNLHPKNKVAAQMFRDFASLNKLPSGNRSFRENLHIIRHSPATPVGKACGLSGFAHCLQLSLPSKTSKKHLHTWRDYGMGDVKTAGSSNINNRQRPLDRSFVGVC